MPIPKHDEIRLPALKLLLVNDTMALREFERPLAKSFNLTDDEIAAEYDSGNGRIFPDRISWALSYMNLAGLLNKPKRGMYQLSEKGRSVLNAPETLNDKIAEVLAQRNSSKKAKSSSLNLPTNDLTPQEELSKSSTEIRAAVCDEILQTIIRKTPRAFESLVVDLLQRMGYGGKIENAGEVTSYSNDKGIDGIIREDVLGLGRIHVQAKRYSRENTVGREEIQRFVGALAVAQSNKGVFITTSSYSKGALDYSMNLNGSTALVLIDGGKLANYIYDYDLGMQVEQVIKIKRLDGDFWDSMSDESTD